VGVALSLGRFVGGRPGPFVWVVEDGEWWGQPFPALGSCRRWVAGGALGPGKWPLDLGWADQTARGGWV